MYGSSNAAGAAVVAGGLGALGWSAIAGVTLVSVGLALLVFVPRLSRRRKATR